MSDTGTHFECEIENLYYITIERKIASYFDMGSPDNSSIPPQMRNDPLFFVQISVYSPDVLSCICTKKSGSFRISNQKQLDGKYALSVDLKGKLHDV